ncbi:unnamed protein product [[Actinomadura] parvosata subsp. kistnae]|uniref:Uncharacterized protein n=1 Tax=[Actinomadura] parvosata subsp. kistnae TaxID=1909395 RepID=A0A1U9ZTI2_9ACTN|nr:DUF4132 domain-containing protein [Nonomuraea sp. ATCC 55076]AQZ61267.1 hypothetical protein BKM31_07000 [Nonomuraea sp. ATCC 55076]SPL97911.1 unnamed protein product [Actinomadura parvosata subsp. kistnae]
MNVTHLLSPEARRLHHHLTEPGAGYPHPWPDTSLLTATDLGHLLPLAYRTTGTGAATSMRFAVEDAVRERQPEFTPASCLALYDALVAGLERRKWADVCLAAGALLRCPGGVPEAELAGPARVLTEFMVAHGRLEAPYALLAVAGVAGVEGAGQPMDEPRESLAMAEREVVLGLDPAGRALVAEVGPRSFGSPPELPGVWDRLAALTPYADFARSALEAAEARLAAIHARELPYRADKAFSAAEVAALGRAARLALHCDAPWLPALLDSLLALVAVAPTAAKTLPSQALLFEIGRAVVRFPTPEAITALRAARAATRHAGVVKQLDRLIKKAEPGLADRMEVAFRMPDLGFGAGGRLKVSLGEYTAVLAPGAGGEFELGWRQGGKPLKSVPAAVRREHPDEVKRLRELVKQVRRQVTTLCRALEAGLAGEMSWPYETWRDRIAGHPIAGTVATRLIWEAEAAPGEWRTLALEAESAPSEGRTLTPSSSPEAGRVRLWHPARASAEEVARLREAVTEGRVKQPFKQAFREVYPLTPAEEATAVYSNRFAGHIVDYRRLYAMFRARNWESRMLGPWDGGDTDAATRVLAEGRWRVSFHHDYLYDEPGEYATTDQVRFHRRDDEGGGGWLESPLAEVPPLVFSEAMRDVDLFVAVTSIAADPGWADRGHDRHLAYWRDTSVGPLQPSGEVRLDALARILPRTAIGGRCTLTDRFLVVRGDLRTYKIHVGSGNILMDPGDVYLCIVPDRRRDERLFLPFEEDDRLALILSKAFLLARDTEITDESILAQIKGGT